MGMQKGYYHVLFLHGYQAKEALNTFKTYGETALFAYFDKFGNRDRHSERNEEPSYSSYDFVVTFHETVGYWIFAYDTELNFCGLEYCYTGLEKE